MNSTPSYHIEPCTPEQIPILLDGLNAYNLSQVPALADTWTPLELVAKDEAGQVIGGILAGIGYWQGVEIKVLWVHEAHRKQGIGTQLLQRLEVLAIERGAEMAMLDTFDFQAEGFYLKHGYRPIGELKGFPKGHRRIYFAKVLGEQHG